MESRRKLNLGHYLIIVVGSLIIIGSIRGCVIQNDIENNGNEIVVKFIRKDRLPKTTNFYFGYYYAGKYYETSASGVQHSIINSEKETADIDSLKRNHFYSAKFKSDDLKNIIVNPSKEISDSVLIRKAGFSLKE
jgi:hypothetical protein